MDSGKLANLGAEPGESFFGFDELIFSRTDQRGVIVSGNTVFQRMCERPWTDLIGAPHRLIRHPDMPRGFFYLFWGLLKQGLPAAGAADIDVGRWLGAGDQRQGGRGGQAERARPANHVL